jgi:hypothetical protein
MRACKHIYTSAVCDSESKKSKKYDITQDRYIHTYIHTHTYTYTYT